MLDIVHGDLWDYHPEHWIVITTNCGWKMNGENVMGAGVAKEARLRYPDLPKQYGQICYSIQKKLGVRLGCVPFEEWKLMLLPTKTLNREMPHLSWQGNSTLDTIEHSLRSLALFANHNRQFIGQDIYLPPPGCGNGGLTLDQVMPLLEKHLAPANAKFHLVLRD